MSSRAGGGTLDRVDQSRFAWKDRHKDTHTCTFAHENLAVLKLSVSERGVMLLARPLGGRV
jgi:hypothetical protein